MKTFCSYLFVLIVCFVIISSCNERDDYITTNEELSIRTDKGGDTPEGCENCRVFMSVDKGCNMKLTLTDGCIGNITYQWTTPTGNSSIPNPDASVNGNYCVTIFTDQGCSASACTNVINCQDACADDCIAVILNDLECQLEVDLNDCDSQPKNIIWSTPMNFIPVGTTVTPEINGVYCAHVSFLDGCSYTDCINIKDCQEFCEEDCNIEFEINNLGTNCFMTVKTNECIGPLEIEWTDPNGVIKTNSSISIQNNGTYCVNVTQSNGCEVNNCIDIINCEKDMDCSNTGYANTLTNATIPCVTEDGVAGCEFYMILAYYNLDGIPTQLPPDTPVIFNLVDPQTGALLQPIDDVYAKGGILVCLPRSYFLAGFMNVMWETFPDSSSNAPYECVTVELNPCF